MALIPYFGSRSVVDFTSKETKALGALKPTVSGIGFYVHKELGAAEVGILSTQRISCGRDPDFIYTKNFRILTTEDRPSSVRRVFDGVIFFIALCTSASKAQRISSDTA